MVRAMIRAVQPARSQCDRCGGLIELSDVDPFDRLMRLDRSTPGPKITISDATSVVAQSVAAIAAPRRGCIRPGQPGSELTGEVRILVEASTRGTIGENDLGLKRVSRDGDGPAEMLRRPGPGSSPGGHASTCIDMAMGGMMLRATATGNLGY